MKIKETKIEVALTKDELDTIHFALVHVDRLTLYQTELAEQMIDIINDYFGKEC